jgi:hypothetical protein
MIEGIATYNEQGEVIKIDTHRVAPFEKRNGVYVELVNHVIFNSSLVASTMKFMGYRFVAHDNERILDIYTTYPFRYFIYKIVEFFRNILREKK